MVLQSLPQIGGDRGTIETVNIAVGEDVTQMIGEAVIHAYGSDSYWDIVIF